MRGSSSMFVAAGLFALGANLAQAQIADSLWIGTDNTSGRLVLNTDRSGNVLRSVGPVEATGFGIDLSSNTIYFAQSVGVITARDLTTLATGSSFSAGGTEDMTLGGGFLWRAGKVGPAASATIVKIDPVTHASSSAFNVPFLALGIAWDGSGLWISEFTGARLVQRFEIRGRGFFEVLCPGGRGEAGKGSDD